MKFKSRAPSAASKFHTSRFLEESPDKKKKKKWQLVLVFVSSTWEPEEDPDWTRRLAAHGGDVQTWGRHMKPAELAGGQRGSGTHSSVVRTAYRSE